MTKPGRAATVAPRRPLALWTVGVLVVFAALFGLWGVNAATTAAAKEKVAPSSSSLATLPASFAPDFASPPLPIASSTTPVTPFMGNAGIVKAGDLKKGDTVWHNGRWLTVANVERKTVEVEATPTPAPSPQPVLEAELNLDLSESNGGRTFDVGRIAPCSQPVFLVSGAKATVGDLKVGDRIHMSGDNIGRVVSITKKWHTPTPPKYDAKGNGYNRVIATTKRMADRLLYLYTSAELVKTTPEHPFAVKGKGYVEAGRLQPGDVLETQDSKVVTVERTEVRNEAQLVYNLEVENAHNFFVGKNAMLVHNGGDCVPEIIEHIPTRSAAQADPVNFEAMTRGERQNWMNLLRDIKENGIKRPVDFIEDPEAPGKFWILDGNHRTQAAQFSGIENIPGIRRTLPFGSYKSWKDVRGF
ncbi:MAG: polymorphic toxin-type HINT domain-containing protein [Capsulimonadales bacterium]|nr:polymorphic toxin-type HINT domain-containing protein [Capsulimonadales bacterium]